MEQRFAIPGSETIQSNGGSWLPVDADHTINPTIVIRRPQRAGDISKELLSGSLRQMSRAEAQNLLRVDPADLTAVETFLKGYGLTIIAESAEARTVHAEGSAVQVGQAFGVTIEWRIDPKARKYLSYQGALTVPAELAGIVEAVLGLDLRPVARRRGAAE
jgi:kumamolisin